MLKRYSFQAAQKGEIRPFQISNLGVVQKRPFRAPQGSGRIGAETGEGETKAQSCDNADCDSSAQEQSLNMISAQ
jgi:hypothetical protein